MLTQAGHDVVRPADVGLPGEDDPVHLAYAAQEGRVFLSGNHRDFLNLHNLVARTHGQHPGILIVRRDNDPKRDLTPAGIVRAIRNLLSAHVAVQNEYTILNHWR